MKPIMSTVLLIHASILLGQVAEVEIFGLNDQPRFTKIDDRYFNEIFENKNGAYNFTDKLIALHNHSARTSESTKSNYFGVLKNIYNRKLTFIIGKQMERNYGF